MKFILLFLTLAIVGTPRYLEGDYFETHHGMVGASWHFEKDGTFTYSEGNCEGGREGNGTYELSGDSLHILFHTPARLRSTSFIRTIKQENKADGWELNLQVQDDVTAEDVIFAIILIRDSAGNLLKQTASDIDGRALVKMPDYKGAILISIQNPGYEKAEVKLSKAGSYALKAILVSGFGPAGVPAGTRYDYRLLSAGKKSMQWQTTCTEPDTTVIIELKKYKP